MAKRKWQQTIDGFDLSEIVPSRLQQLIDIMQRVKDKGRAFDMTYWQAPSEHELIENESDLHKCGTAACLAGWLTVSPEFHEVGGWMCSNGAPRIRDYRYANAVHYFLQGESTIQKDDEGNSLTEYLIHPTFGLYQNIVRDAKAVLARLRYIQKSLPA